MLYRGSFLRNYKNCRHGQFYRKYLRSTMVEKQIVLWLFLINCKIYFFILNLYYYNRCIQSSNWENRAPYNVFIFNIFKKLSCSLLSLEKGNRTFFCQDNIFRTYIVGINNFVNLYWIRYYRRILQVRHIYKSTWQLN